jgi:hypothetical protein
VGRFNQRWVARQLARKIRTRGRQEEEMDTDKRLTRREKNGGVARWR